MRLALFRPSSGQGKRPSGMPERCRICACLVRHRLSTPACRSQRICRGCRPKQTAHYAQKSALTITADAVVHTNGQGAVGPDRACRYRKGNAASHDRHGTRAAVDLPPRRQVRARMETKDVSFGHDPAGSCTAIALHPLIQCALGNRACPGALMAKPACPCASPLSPKPTAGKGGSVWAGRRSWTGLHGTRKGTGRPPVGSVPHVLSRKNAASKDSTTGSARSSTIVPCRVRVMHLAR